MKSMPIFLKATEEDIPVILEMMENFNALFGYAFDRKLARQLLSEFIGNESLGRLWVVQLGSLKVGYIALSFGFSFEYGGRDAFIDELFIKEGYRGNGIGRQTMAFIESQARQLGINAIHLEVEGGNMAGKHLYGELGYKENNRSLLTRKIALT